MRTSRVESTADDARTNEISTKGAGIEEGKELLKEWGHDENAIAWGAQTRNVGCN